MEQRDSETGLDPTLFRMYNGRLYRWLTPDPVAGSILNPQSLNRYAYVLNNPTNFIDPLGLDTVYCFRRRECSIPVSYCGSESCTIEFCQIIEVCIDVSLGPGNTSGGGKDKKCEVVKLAFEQPDLQNCIQEKFGSKASVSEKSSPALEVVPQSEIDRRSQTQGMVATYSSRGRGTVFISSNWFNDPQSSVAYLASTYIHELGNILSEKTYGKAVFWPDWSRGPYNPKIREWDVDMGAALEECVYLGIVTQSGALYP